MPSAPVTRPGLTTGRALLIALLGVLLHVGQLRGPFPDGQHGNCGAMFSIFARNAQALGFGATLGLPVVNPVPPASLDQAEFYAHHPPGLPWLVLLASRLPLAIETAARLLALLATLAAALLLADLGTRLAGRHAGLAAALLFLALPAGLHHGLLVNYETVALPALLLLLRALLLERPRAWISAAIAALVDWVALLPLLWMLRWPLRRSWWQAVAAAACMLLLGALLARRAQPGALSGTLAQGLATTFLAPDFEASEWLAALRTHLVALYGWALLPAALALAMLPQRSALLRRALLALLATGLLNVGLFARHATGHEHFSLLLLPYVALATATLLFPREHAARPPGGVGALLLVVLLALGWAQSREAAPARTATSQSQLADSLRGATDLDTLYLRPAGAGFVFLQRAERHVAPQPVWSLAAARAAADAYRARFGLPLLPAALAVAPGESPPDWAADALAAHAAPASAAEQGSSVAEAPLERDGWRFYPLH